MRSIRALIRSIALLSTLTFASAQNLDRLPRFPGGADSAPPPPSPTLARRNLILMIGDGMGVAQRTAARLMTVGSEGRTEIDRLPGLCLVTTWSADAMTTDSAASATAYACGVKTNNTALGLDRTGNPTPSILELAQQAGYATGLVATSDLTDATPAAFYAHTGSRVEWWEILDQLLRVAPDLLLGGGWSAWIADGVDLAGTPFRAPRSASVPP